MPGLFSVDFFSFIPCLDTCDTYHQIIFFFFKDLQTGQDEDKKDHLPFVQAVSEV